MPRKKVSKRTGPRSSSTDRPSKPYKKTKPAASRSSAGKPRSGQVRQNRSHETAERKDRPAYRDARPGKAGEGLKKARSGRVPSNRLRERPGKATNDYQNRNRQTRSETNRPVKPAYPRNDRSIVSQEHLLFGRRTVAEFLKSKHKPEKVRKVYHSPGLDEGFLQKLRKACTNARFLGVERTEMDEMFRGNHQGIVLELDPSSYPGLYTSDVFEFMAKHKGPYLVLDRISDSQNLGSLIRSAEALGARAVVMTGRGAGLDAVVHRISSGASLHIPVFHTANLERFCSRARELEFWMAASGAPEDLPEDPDSSRKNKPVHCTHKDIHKVLPEAEKMVLIIGSEGNGIKPLVLARSDYLISIPLPGKTGSLNAGVAAAILLERIIFR